MGLTIGILIVTTIFTLGIIFFVWKFVSGSMGDSKTLANGVPGSAMVMSLEPTGTVINDMYYVCSIGLRVTLPAQAPYDVMIKQSVPITAMARVNPGGTIGVKVDPADQTKVVIDWQSPIVVPMAGMAGMAPAGPMSAADIAAAAAAATAAGAVGGGMQVSSSKELLDHGQRVLGVLTEFADTGNTPRTMGVAPSKPEFIDDPMYALSLQLHVSNTAPLEAKVVQRVPRAMVPQLTLGLQLNCAVDPADPTRNVAVDWGDL